MQIALSVARPSGHLLASADDDVVMASLWLARVVSRGLVSNTEAITAGVGVIEGQRPIHHVGAAADVNDDVEGALRRYPLWT